jgi:hypothetical protein
MTREKEVLSLALTIASRTLFLGGDWGTVEEIFSVCQVDNLIDKCLWVYIRKTMNQRGEFIPGFDKEKFIAEFFLDRLN